MGIIFGIPIGILCELLKPPASIWDWITAISTTTSTSFAAMVQPATQYPPERRVGYPSRLGYNGMYAPGSMNSLLVATSSY